MPPPPPSRQVADQIFVYHSITPLNASEWADYVKGEEGSSSAVVSATTTTTTTTYATIEATLRKQLWGPPTDAETVSASRASAVAAASWLSTSLLSNVASIRLVVKRPFMPDSVGVTRPASAIVLGSEASIIAGAMLTIMITRAAPIIPTRSRAALSLALGGDAAADVAVAALSTAHLPSMLAVSNGGGGGVSIVVSSGVAVNAIEGTHYFMSPELALSRSDALAAGLSEAWGV
jgi:hypothetical protein